MFFLVIHYPFLLLPFRYGDEGVLDRGPGPVLDREVGAERLLQVQLQDGLLQRGREDGGRNSDGHSGGGGAGGGSLEGTKAAVENVSISCPNKYEYPIPH